MITTPEPCPLSHGRTPFRFHPVSPDLAVRSTVRSPWSTSVMPERTRTHLNLTDIFASYMSERTRTHLNFLGQIAPGCQSRQGHKINSPPLPPGVDHHGLSSGGHARPGAVPRGVIGGFL